MLRFKSFDDKITHSLRDLTGVKHCNDLARNLRKYGRYCISLNVAIVIADSMNGKVSHLGETQKTLPKKTKQLEKHFTKLSPAEMKPVYDTYVEEAKAIDDDLREATRRKPKKAKTSPSKAGAPASV